MDRQTFLIVYVIGALLAMGIVAFVSGYNDDKEFSHVEIFMCGIMWPGFLLLLAAAATIFFITYPFTLISAAGRKTRELQDRKQETNVRNS